MKRLICMVGALLAGLTLSQAPEYAQQYGQRLGGAVDELQAIIEQFDADAAGFGLSRDEGLARYAASPDDFLAERGISMQAVFARHAALTTQLAALRSAAPFERTLTVAQGFDGDIGTAALRDYQPALPLTVEGLVHALAGLLAGYALIWSGWTLAARPFRNRQRRARRAGPDRIEPRL